MNCDGSVKDNGRSAGCGGVLRDSQGRLVFAYALRLHPTTIVKAELWGLFHGLRIALERGYQRISVEMDSAEAHSLVIQESYNSVNTPQVLTQLQNLRSGDTVIEWKKINREANLAADTLAKRSHQMEDTIVIFDSTPDFLVHVLISDLGGSSDPDQV